KVNTKAFLWALVIIYSQLSSIKFYTIIIILFRNFVNKIFFILIFKCKCFPTTIIFCFYLYEYNSFLCILLFFNVNILCFYFLFVIMVFVLFFVFFCLLYAHFF